MNNLLDKVESQLIAHYPWIRGKPENEIVLSFLIWGAAHVLMESKYEEAVLLDTSTRVARHIIVLIDVQDPAAS
jgi:hypothetical protein